MPSGPINDDLDKCNVEDLEQANDSQLYTILNELQQTAFFRSFVVDLDESCPITTWSTKKKASQNESSASSNKAETESTSSSSSKDEPSEEEFMCSGPPDLDPDAEPACSITDGGDEGGGFDFSPDFSADAASFSVPPSKTTDTTTSTTPEPTEEAAVDEFECDGGGKDLDDDAEPLCSLAHDEEEELTYSNSKTPIADLISSAFKSLSFGRWESESQKQAFSWSQQTDPVVIESQQEAADCDTDEQLLRDTFWVDMCKHIQTGETRQVVNLQLNPERNTGYNGTHIWNAIYQENCIAQNEMCYEERVLYRLLSGLHTSTTLSIATNYYAPSKRKGRETWEPNPQYFMDKFEGNPEHIRNLHFSYVVLLRALHKAAPFLYNYDIRTGDIVQDEKATILLRRLLDSSILQSCQSIFSAFDESLMFKEQVSATSDVVSLQQNFKGVFHNVSSILDCVQCQQCKLHGKMTMLGYGTALKILFMNESRLASSLERNEIVAFINTIAKFSESLREVRELTHLYWERMRRNENVSPSTRLGSTSTGATVERMSVEESSLNLVDTAVGLAALLARDGHIGPDREAELVRLALTHNADLLALAKHYGSQTEKFLAFSEWVGVGTDSKNMDPDAIIIGSGLAGLAVALNILDRGGSVVIMEKEHLVGGNSNKASSGINACCPENDKYGDFLDSFKNDTIKSAGEAARPELIEILVQKSGDAVTWLKERVGVDLSLLAQLGGHAYKRTHRPSNGMAGAEIIYGMQKAVKSYEKTGKVKIMLDTRVTQLLRDDTGRVVGVEYQPADGSAGKELLQADNVVLATGGFAADRSEGSYLSKYRPELLKMPATAGSFSTGDGISLAASLGAGTVDMDKIQIHPTGWIDPVDPKNPTKVLAAELMRGVGGILFNSSGKRFCNELGTRAYVTGQMLSHDEQYAKHGVWNLDSEIPTFSLVLSSSAALDGKKHVDLYTHKRLMTRFEGVSALAEWMGVDVEIVRSSLRQYQEDAEAGKDQWGKSSFRGIPTKDLDSEVFYAGRVTPVLHYCMGGISIDTEGNVLDESGITIPGLHAAGEVTGGVHGNNRLGGNSLLECTVFGSIVGKKIAVKKVPSNVLTPAVNSQKEKKEERTVSIEELAKHDRPDDCWVAIHGTVYDLTEFAEEHPAGPISIHELAGKDGTSAFEAVHNAGLMEDFEEERIGTLEMAAPDRLGAETENKSPTADRTVSRDELKDHDSPDDCWVSFHGEVYDMTNFAKSHPGGAHLIQDVAGKDGTETFREVHKKGKLKLVDDDRIGKLEG